MSNTENSENTNNSEEAENTVDSTTDAKGNALAKIMELKDSNPKVFFGAIGAVVVLLLIIMMSGGSSKKLHQSGSKNLSVGQEYTLKSANSVSENSTVSFVAAPNVAAFDDSEEKGAEKSPCKQQPQGTSVKILALQGIFAQAEILSEGQCQGRKGWVLVKDFK